MEIAELRTGNLILNSKDQVCRVVYIDGRYEPHEIIVQILSEPPITISETSVPRNERYHIDEIKPIMLTDDILMKIGFKVDWKQNGYEAKLGTFKIWRGYNWPCFTFNSFGDISDDEENFFNIKLEHVHKLHNLYFALTTKELDIKI